ncbi:hypothetical protein NERG_02375 [Nematocida ausubeli]|uniref:Small ribosomal subunit protein eS1 n=1 Tax=Nematocida ausubeli (strain ATCC PRA-371 / ERTm2) TaxID=1913371 RepID=H8ZFK4_NEMA1|nr:hypothetical protein NERG_02375 [Nematocida ausubeli]
MASKTKTTKGKKIKSKKPQDIMTKKEFYNLTLPSLFNNKSAGTTIIDKSQGNYFAPDALRGRTFEVNQADLPDNTNSTRKFKFVIDGTKGKDAISSFHSMELISDKVKSIPKKWHTLIETCSKVETQDGYTLRIFTICNTKRKAKSVSKNCYAKLSQVKSIRKVIFKIVSEEFAGDINEAMKKMMTEVAGGRMEQEGAKIYPLQNCYIKKVKVLKRPRIEEGIFDVKVKGKKVEVIE